MVSNLKSETARANGTKSRGRYEARLQRVYDQAYKTLRELQQARKSEPPQEPHTVNVHWVDSQEELGMRAAVAQPATKLRNEPTTAASKEDTVAQAFVVPKRPPPVLQLPGCKFRRRRCSYAPGDPIMDLLTLTNYSDRLCRNPSVCFFDRFLRLKDSGVLL
jgi:hypothetical protein